MGGGAVAVPVPSRLDGDGAGPPSLDGVGFIILWWLRWIFSSVGRDMSGRARRGARGATSAAASNTESAVGGESNTGGAAAAGGGGGRLPPVREAPSNTNASVAGGGAAAAAGGGGGSIPPLLSAQPALAGPIVSPQPPPPTFAQLDAMSPDQRAAVFTQYSQLGPAYGSYRLRQAAEQARAASARQAAAAGGGGAAAAGGGGGGGVPGCKVIHVGLTRPRGDTILEDSAAILNLRDLKYTLPASYAPYREDPVYGSQIKAIDRSGHLRVVALRSLLAQAIQYRSSGGASIYINPLLYSAAEWAIINFEHTRMRLLTDTQMTMLLPGRSLRASPSITTGANSFGRDVPISMPPSVMGLLIDVIYAINNGTLPRTNLYNLVCYDPGSQRVLPPTLSFVPEDVTSVTALFTPDIDRRLAELKAAIAQEKSAIQGLGRTVNARGGPAGMAAARAEGGFGVANSGGVLSQPIIPQKDYEGVLRRLTVDEAGEAAAITTWNARLAALKASAVGALQAAAQTAASAARGLMAAVAESGANPWPSDSESDAADVLVVARTPAVAAGGGAAPPLTAAPLAGTRRPRPAVEANENSGEEGDDEDVVGLPPPPKKAREGSNNQAGGYRKSRKHIRRTRANKKRVVRKSRKHVKKSRQTRRR